MVRKLLLGSSFVLILLMFLFFNMKNEKRQVNDYKVFSRNYSEQPVLAVHKVINCKMDVYDLKVIDGNYYFNSFQRQHLVMLDSMGHEKRTWRTEGTGKMLFPHIVAWNADEAGITVIDGQLQKVIRMSPSDSVIYEKNLPYQVISASWLENDLYIIKVPDAVGKHIYRKLNVSTMQIEELDFDLPEYEYPDFTLAGYFVKGGTHNFYVCAKTGYFFSYNNKGEYLYGTNTIDKTDPPIVMVSSQGSKRYHPLATIVNQSAFAKDNVFFVLSARGSASDQKDTSVIDCYSVTDGSYLKSISLPPYEGQYAYGIFPSEKGFIAVYADYIVKYRSNDPLL